ncbi:DEAD/DEAH box helicase [Ktedonosporobacter rubrisoli]|uniref:DNA 3'-5' helicase n=1 Tax=Ktedonosporobacter rubrisoli TaxID=2509675 RepID=A0A4P6K3N8_KTERU|nr:DNA repair helicase XPB [Ktedonosporobacter rubrisoli]QBD82106.1 DEAD/DEAH box helicase [Ktedonosporobacter rubrisoli]
MKPSNPMIVQSDRTILLEVDHPRHAEARDALAQFAELEKSPEHIHTYRLSPLSLWNAAAGGMSAQHILELLSEYSKYAIPSNIATDIREYINRYGKIKLILRDGALLLTSDETTLVTEIMHNKRMQPYLLQRLDTHTIQVDASRRGHIKQALIHIGFPAEDLAGYTEGSPLPIQLLQTSHQDKDFAPRAYQHAASAAFYAGGAPSGGSGVVVLPCGAGKTIVGLVTMANIQRATLILTPNTIAVRQWINEILDKTDIPPEMVGEYTGERKDIAPITISTYQILTYRRPNGEEDGGSEQEDYPHFSLLTSYDWGLIIYDEVHLLPAPVFRVTAEIQARRRLGLTATLVREDGREADVFSLIGPKKYDVPWRELERQGWIATAECHEIRVSLTEDEQLNYALAEVREKYRIAAESPAKLTVTRHLVERHCDDQILIIGQYIEQLKLLAEELRAPLLTGRTSNGQREKLYEKFRRGELKRLVVSKVANFAIDLPDANVAIQVSGTFGSRQEEAQRLGRILRPKSDGGLAYFYSIVTRDTRDQEFSANRQLFLTEQGYRYIIEDAEALLAG